MVHTFSGNPLDREDAGRRDDAWIDTARDDDSTRFLALSNLNVPIEGESLHWLHRDDFEASDVEGALLLGSAEGAARFVVDLSSENASADRYVDARSAAAFLSREDAGVVAHARSLVDWHRKNNFCGRCASPLVPSRGGNVLQCAQCEANLFPRTDPVAIMVIVDGDHCLLGQSYGRLSTSNIYSALAGFIDQGESIEEAVRREVMEEGGVRVGDVRYHSSQPWPFPSSLMIGCHGRAETTEISIDYTEMNDVRWFPREEVLAALAGETEELRLPGRMAIAHHLIHDWATGVIDV